MGIQMVNCDAASNDILLNQKTEAIIGASFDVMNELGTGFLESVYHRSFAIALSHKGFEVQSEVSMVVSFRGLSVGNFRADLVVDNEIIVEVKAIDKIAGAHKAQVINYLAASGLRTGLIINFGNPRVEIARLSNPKIIKLDSNYPAHPDI